MSIPCGSLILGFSRNVANILLYLAERSRRYFPAKEIPNMLQTFLPILTKEVCI